MSFEILPRKKSVVSGRRQNRLLAKGGRWTRSSLAGLPDLPAACARPSAGQFRFSSRRDPALASKPCKHPRQREEVRQLKAMAYKLLENNRFLLQLAQELEGKWLGSDSPKCPRGCRFFPFACGKGMRLSVLEDPFMSWLEWLLRLVLEAAFELSVEGVVAVGLLRGRQCFGWPPVLGCMTTMVPCTGSSRPGASISLLLQGWSAKSGKRCPRR
eukprot:s582_g15.t1